MRLDALQWLLLALVTMVALHVFTPLESDLTSTVLLTDGLFAWSRNPVYLGMLMLLAGQAMMLGTVVALVTWPAFWLWLHWRFIGAKERVLLATFGEAYAQYRSRVRRWL